jgi:hypothetical protein
MSEQAMNADPNDVALLIAATGGILRALESVVD